jgi:hypothetical protein
MSQAGGTAGASTCQSAGRIARIQNPYFGDKKFPFHFAPAPRQYR